MSTTDDTDLGEISDENIIRLLERAEWPLSTSEVGDKFGVTPQGAYKRLRNLREEREVEKRKTPSTALWRPA